jgi:hypothetical protein
MELLSNSTDEDKEMEMGLKRMFWQKDWYSRPWISTYYFGGIYLSFFEFVCSVAWTLVIFSRTLAECGFFWFDIVAILVVNIHRYWMILVISFLTARGRISTLFWAFFTIFLKIWSAGSKNSIQVELFGWNSGFLA